ncbi:unnamed protein product [Orchesella dallaii]|uniref:Uncharacterized protein n=1 Tax=Orchesella dallaii TaxID=48710 RepID=A0ABP1R4B3_9HEXA
MAWQSHLVQSAHQNRVLRTREDWRNWTDATKECCVVILGKVPPQSLLGFLSHGRNQIVNFFDSTKENAAKIVQFENDRSVSQLFYEVEQAPNVMIEGNQILLIRGVDYFVDGSEDLNSKTEVDFDDFLEKTHEGPSTLLWSEFSEIYNEVISPKDDFLFVFSILERTRNIVELLDPSVKLNLFRHCYMKELAIYAFFPNLPPSCTTSGRIGHRRLAWQLQKAEMEVLNCNVETDEITLLDKQTGIEFRLICNPLQEQEGVVNELHKLLFTFDPRGKAMLIMLLYWIRQHGIRLLFKQRIGIEELQEIPEVLGLQWLCIFYLCQRGYLPTPREVISRPVEESVKSIGIIRRSGAETWFPRDYDFVRGWRSNIMDMPEIGTDGFVLDVLEMLQGFLEFCDSIDFKNLALNPVDVELLTRNEVVKGMEVQEDENMLKSCILVCEKMFEPRFIKELHVKLTAYLKRCK